MRLPFTFLQLPKSADLPKIVRQVEHDIETVINVLKPGPLGILEHKFTDAELQNAKATVARAVSNWQGNTDVEKSIHDSMHSAKDETVDV